jgi:hypothetical protein
MTHHRCHLVLNTARTIARIRSGQTNLEHYHSRQRSELHRQKSRPVGRRQSVDPPAVILPSLQRSHAVSGGQPSGHQSPPLLGWKARDFDTCFCGLGDRAKITSHFPAGSFARRLRCSLLTDPLAGYARRSRLASGQNSRAVKHEFIFARSLGHHLSLPPARADAARPPNPWARNPPLRVFTRCGRACPRRRCTFSLSRIRRIADLMLSTAGLFCSTLSRWWMG